MNFSLDHLEAFVAAAECGSFSAAGRRLGKVQSAVSTAVANLEIDTGVQLFDRSGKYPRITCEGEILLRDARMILARCTDFQNRAYAFGDDVDARIRIGVDEIIPQSFLSAVLKAFDEQFPETELEILYGTLKDIQILVEEDRADIGLLVPLSFPEQSVSSRLLTHMPFAPVAAPNHPLAKLKTLTLADLSVHRQLVITSRGGERELEEVIFSNRPWMLENTPLIHDLVKKGVGYSFLPRYLVEDEIKAGALVQLPVVLEKTEHTAPVFLIWSPVRPVGKAGQWMMEALSAIECR